METKKPETNQQLLVNRAEKYILPRCQIHSQQSLQKLCTVPECEYFFRPACIECIENHDHNIKGLQNIKPILETFAKQVQKADDKYNESAKENEEVHYNMYKMIIRYSKQFKNLADTCTSLSNDIKQQADDLMKLLNGDSFQIQAKQHLEEIFNSTGSTLKLQQNLKHLKKLIDINKGDSQVNLTISQKKANEQYDYEETINEIRFHFSQNIKKLTDQLKVLEDCQIEDLIVMRQEEKKISKQACAKCAKRLNENDMVKNEDCGHFYCKPCLSSFKDIFIKSKKSTHIKCLGNLNKVCDKLISRKRWEQILGMTKVVSRPNKLSCDL